MNNNNKKVILDALKDSLSKKNNKHLTKYMKEPENVNNYLQ